MRPGTWYSSLPGSGRPELALTKEDRTMKRIALLGTAAMLVAACAITPPADEPSQLSVSISGLPAGVAAGLSVFGPEEFSAEVKQSETLRSLAPGEYEIVALDVIHDNAIYSVTVSESVVEVPAGTMVSVKAEYREEVAVEPDTGSPDDQLARMAEILPDFGGLFFDDDGVMNVFLLDPDPARERLVTRALMQVYGGDILARGVREEREEREVRDRTTSAQPAGQSIKMIQGTFNMPSLLDNYRRMDNVLAIEGVVFIDLDEARNRITVGGENASALQRIQDGLEKLRIPREMVIFEEAEPIRFFSHTLRGSFDPNLGGIQIRNSGGGTCTAGFNAFRSGVRGMVTNSHCTNIQGGAEATVFFQPTVNTANFIGTEIADPGYTLGWPFPPIGSWVHGYWCPPLRRCRVSDSAFASYTGGAASSHARIARVTGVGTTGGGNGSLDINHSNPTYRIVSKTSFPVSGEWLDKMGRTTGHTYGRVNKTCAMANVADTNITLLCQDRVGNTRSTFGDSGSPVFRWSSGGDVSLYGVLWGGSGSQFWFSAMWNIQKELGTLVTN